MTRGLLGLEGPIVPRAKTSLCVVEAQRLHGGCGSTSLQAEKSLGSLHPWSNVSFSNLQVFILGIHQARALTTASLNQGRRQSPEASRYSRKSSGAQGSSRLVWTMTLQCLLVTRIAG